MDGVLLTGTVGAGKTTTASALSDLAWRRGLPHAVVDLDDIRRLLPPPADDPFQFEVELRNLRSLARNYADAGARLLIVSGVVESAQDLRRVHAAMGGGALTVVRLVIAAAVHEQRLRDRHGDDAEGLAWHTARAPELTGILDRADLADLVVDTSDRTPQEIAEALLPLIPYGISPATEAPAQPRP